MDSLLRGLFDDQDDDVQSQDKARDFIRRYEEGAPADNIDDGEALKNFHAVAGKVSPQEFEDATTEALERVAPEERAQFANLLQRASGGEITETSDPREVARLTTQVQSQQPDLLEGLLGGLLSGGGQNIGGLLDSVLGGTSAGKGQGQGIDDLINSVLGGQNSGAGQGKGQVDGLGGLLQSPMARSILAGIAAMVMKRLMGDKKA